MSLINIKKLLRQSIGLNASSIGDSSIERAVKHRLDNLKLSSMDEYYQRLLDDTEEASELIEEIVVPETWFFRNNTPFDSFRDYFIKNLQPKLLKNETVRILSVPCATGEEAYSVAITLLDAGIPLQNIEIDAMDISKRALTKARRAIYCKNSFRGVANERIQKNHFEECDTGYQVKPVIRNSVDFKQGNFLVGPLSPQLGYYDVIFCRNLLIYFDHETQVSAIEKLHRSLKENGVLFVGHAETSLVPRALFERLYTARSFGFRKLSAANTNQSESAPLTLPEKVPDQWQGVFEQLAKLPTSETDNSKTPSSANNKNTRKRQKEAASKTKKTKKLSLRTAQRLVNEGKLEKALHHCEAYLKQSPNVAHAYYIMGLIKNNSNNTTEAEELLRKAIYLNPNHEQALVLCGLLAEKRGDRDSALSYKRRAARVAGRNRPKSA